MIIFDWAQMPNTVDQSLHSCPKVLWDKIVSLLLAQPKGHNLTIRF